MRSKAFVILSVIFLVIGISHLGVATAILSSGGTDAANPVEYIFFLSGGIMTIVGAVFGRFVYQSWKKKKYLEEFGVPFQARIISITDSALRVNNVRQKNIEIEFMGQTKKIKYVSPKFLEEYEVGKTIEVRYDPQNSENFMLWGNPMMQNPGAALKW